MTAGTGRKRTLSNLETTRTLSKRREEKKARPPLYLLLTLSLSFCLLSLSLSLSQAASPLPPPPSLSLARDNQPRISVASRPLPQLTLRRPCLEETTADDERFGCSTMTTASS